jgi:hypothetical protein
VEASPTPPTVLAGFATNASTNPSSVFLLRAVPLVRALQQAKHEGKARSDVGQATHLERAREFVREESDDDAAPRGRRGGVVAEASCRLVWRGARHVYARDVTDTATTLSAPAGGRCQASRAPHAPRHESFEWHCAISLVVLQKCHPRPSQNGGPGRSEGGSSHWTRIDPRSGHAAHNGTVGDHAAPWRHRRTVGRAWRPPRPPRGCDAAKRPFGDADFGSLRWRSAKSARRILSSSQSETLAGV